MHCKPSDDKSWSSAVVATVCLVAIVSLVGGKFASDGIGACGQKLEPSAKAGRSHLPWIECASPRHDGRAVVLSVARPVSGGALITPPGSAERTLWLLDVQSRKVRRLQAHPAPMTEISWRQHTDQIAFATQRWNIEILDVTSSARQTIRSDPKESMFMWPAWDPSGERVSFQGNVFGDRYTDRVLFSARPGGPAKLEADDLSTPLAWCWDPHSKKLLYVPTRRSRDGQSSRRTAHVFVPDWREETEVLKWSPDGAFLACVRARTGDLDFSLVILDRALKKRVFESAFPLSSRSVVWAPDSRTVLVTAAGERNSAATVRAVDLPSGRVRVLGQPTLADASPQGWTTGTHGENRILYLDRDRTTLLETEGLTGDVHRLAALDEGGELALLR